jgi:hypothetical protein
MHPSTATRLALQFLGLLVVNAFLAAAVWRMVAPKRPKSVRSLAHSLALLMTLANAALSGYALYRMWPERWDVYHVSLLLLGMVFAFRFGGAIRGSSP